MLFLRRIRSFEAALAFRAASPLGITWSSLKAGQRFCTSDSVSTERWTCSCGFSNFSFRGACFHCHAANPNATSTSSSGSSRVAPMEASGMIDGRESGVKPFGASFGGSPSMPSTMNGVDAAAFSSDPFSSSAAERKPVGFQQREFRNGDWKCRCGAHNFSRRQTCFTCHAPKNGQIKFNIKPGDWICSACNSHNFKSRLDCFSCHTKKAGNAGGFVLPGDEPKATSSVTPWTCQSCHSINDADVETCHVCTAERPASDASPATTAAAVGGRNRYPNDWICPSCSFINFQSRVACKSCNETRPVDAKTVGQAAAAGGVVVDIMPPISTPTASASNGQAKDWTCACGFVNFHFRTACKMCNALKAAPASSQTRGDVLGSKLDEEHSI